MVEETKVPDGWTQNGQPFNCGGKAYGLDENLHTVCIGDAKPEKASTVPIRRTRMQIRGFNAKLRESIGKRGKG